MLVLPEPVTLGVGLDLVPQGPTAQASNLESQAYLT